MVTLKPFAALRPRAELAKQIASVPYDVINREEAKTLAKSNPYSFLHICRSEIDLPDNIDEHDEQVYAKARKNLEHFITEGILQQDEHDYFYIYRLNRAGHIQTGLAVAASVDDYLSGCIKKHEHTRPAKEQDRIDHFAACRCHTEAVFLTYKNDGVIPPLLNHWCDTHQAVYDFVADDGVVHQFWLIDDLHLINRLQQYFSSVEALYIADGHHRSASAAKVCQQYRQAHPCYTGNEPFNDLLAVVFPHDELQILDYNRLVQDLNGLSIADFLEKLAKDYWLTPQDFPYRPESPRNFGLCVKGQWYQMALKDHLGRDEGPDGLDAAILQNTVLAPILGIIDPRRDTRIDFIGGNHSLAELEQHTLQDMAVAFVLHPVSIDNVIDTADREMVMPAKSTWFEPKLRSGLFLRLLENRN